MTTRVTITDELLAVCPRFAALKRSLPPADTRSAARRTAHTHALTCTVCGPIAEQERVETAATTARHAAEARLERILWAIPVIDDTAKIITRNGYCRTYLWDTDQAQRGTPPEDCRVDIAGAIAIALHDNPRYAGHPNVRAAEQLVAEYVDAPRLDAWYAHPGVDKAAVLALLRRTAAGLRTELAPEADHLETR